MSTPAVDPEVIDTYARDGVVCVRGVFDPGEIAQAVRGIQRVLEEPSPVAQVVSATGDPGRFSEDFCRWTEIAEIAELAQHSRVPEIAAALMVTQRVRLYHDHVLVKEGGTKQRTPWHQDQPYSSYPSQARPRLRLAAHIDGRGISAWIPVDPVPESGCLEMLAGSHLGPWLMPRTFLAGEAKWFPEGALAELPDVEADRETYDIRRYDMAPGMRSSSTSSPCTARRASPSPEAGLEMDHRLFPVVWPERAAT